MPVCVHMSSHSNQFTCLALSVSQVPKLIWLDFTNTLSELNSFVCRKLTVFTKGKRRKDPEPLNCKGPRVSPLEGPESDGSAWSLCHPVSSCCWPGAACEGSSAAAAFRGGKLSRAFRMPPSSAGEPGRGEGPHSHLSGGNKAW